MAGDGEAALRPLAALLHPCMSGEGSVQWSDSPLAGPRFATHGHMTLMDSWIHDIGQTKVEILQPKLQPNDSNLSISSRWRFLSQHADLRV